MGEPLKPQFVQGAIQALTGTQFRAGLGLYALEDAVGKHWKNKNYGISKGHYAESARAWFLESNRDFMTVCEYAGFDHRYIRMKAHKFFERKYGEENLRRV